jgi:uncharacterized membrane protein
VSIDAQPAPSAAEVEEPAPRKKRRVFNLSFSGAGILVAAFFFAMSLQPSLLPRAPYVQGVVSGITVMIGYGLGAGGQALWRFM